MKLKDLVKHLEQHHCFFMRQGGSHTVNKNMATGKMTTVPRHREVKENLAKKICDELGIDFPQNPR